MGIKFFCDECKREMYRGAWGKIYEVGYLMFCSEKCKKKNTMRPIMEALDTLRKCIKEPTP